MKKVPFIYIFIRGAIGKKFVVKHYRYGIVLTKFPDMKGIVASKKQRNCRDLFCRAVAYAKMVNTDAVLKAAWKQRIKKGTVYHAAIREFMQRATAIAALPVPVRRRVGKPVAYALHNYSLSLPNQVANNHFFLAYKETG